MSNYYVGTIYAPLPPYTSTYSAWAIVNYSLDPADASDVVSAQGHLVKSTLQARDGYTSYIESHNLRSGWGGTYTWQSGEMNVNEGPTEDNCAFYVKYKGQWINLRDNTAVEQAGLDSIFELQTTDSADASYYALLRTWTSGNEDKYQFGYTVSIKQNSTLEDFKDSTNEAIIIEFLADINSEDTGGYADITLGATSPLLVLEGEIKAVEEVWETGTGSLIPSSWNYEHYKDTNAQGTQINFPSVKPVLPNTPWLSKNSVGKRIDPYFSDSANAGTSEVYALKKGCLIGSTQYDELLLSAEIGSGTIRSGVIYRNVDGTYGILMLGGSIADKLALLEKDPTFYDAYRFQGDDAFVMLDVIAGGGGGGNAHTQGSEFAGGGGGGAGGSCRLAVRLTEGDLLFIEAGTAGPATQDGAESRVCLVNYLNVVSSGVVCDGGHAGSSATNHEGQFAGGKGGAVYWCAEDGYSMGQNITYEDGVGTTVVVWDSVDQVTQKGLADGSNIYVIFAATGGSGGHGGDDKFITSNSLYAQRGWQPQYNGSSFEQFSMITNASTQATFSCESVGSNGGNYYQLAGGCGGYAINIWESSAGGRGGRRVLSSGDPHPNGYDGSRGGGGGGAAAFNGAGTPGAGGEGIIYVSR